MMLCRRGTDVENGEEISITYYEIPNYNETPSDDMINWLNTFPLDQWEGDESGIVIHSEDENGESVLGGPGDVVAAIGGRLRIFPRAGRQVEKCIVDEREQWFWGWDLGDGRQFMIPTRGEGYVKVLAPKDPRSLWCVPE